MKSKISVSINDDALAMLKEASEHERISVSAMTEKAIRYLCSDYSPHRIEVDWLESNRTSVRIERNGTLFYYRRGVQRHHVENVQGTLIIDTIGPIETTLLTKVLLNYGQRSDLFANSGRPIVFKTDDIRVEITNFPKKVEQNHTFIPKLISICASTIENLETTSFREIAKRICPMCNVPLIGLNVWMPGGEKEEVEWVCGVGHRVSNNEKS